jgi:DNA (cytosine-5)-methyltransferase 1
MKRRLLDLFSGGGGAGFGYRDWFDVIGADTADHAASYAHVGEFHRMDWAAALEKFGGTVDAIHASPPCQAYSQTRGLSNGQHPMLIDDVRAALEATSLPYVIENVQGSGLPEQPDLFGREGLLLCGAMFGLRTYRHRLFEVSVPVPVPPHPMHMAKVSPLGRPLRPGEFMAVVGHFPGVEDGRAAMGAPWLSRAELAQAIPPAYTRFIGKYLLEA